MANKRIPELDPVVTAAQSDKFIVRQSGDVEDKHADMDIMQLALLLTESQITDLQSYLLVEANDLTAAVVWANIPDANVPESAVTQHEAALSITESQISDLQAYLLAEVNDLSAAVVWANIPDANVPESAVTQHEAALSITESQISDLSHTIGVSGLGIWKYRTETGAPPASGQIRFNNANVSLATEFFLSETNEGGVDVSTFLELLLQDGSALYIQDQTDAANFILIEISSSVDNGTFRTYGIANIIEEGTEPGQNDNVVLITTGLASAGGVVEVNDLTAAVVWANIPDTNVPESAVTQHEAALAITESQIADGTILARVGSNETITNSWTFEGDITLEDGASLIATSGAANEQFQLAQCDDISEIQFGSAVTRFDIGIGAPTVKTRLGTGFYLAERAAAGDDVTGFGQFWARTDNTPMFTDEAGVDYVLNALPSAEVNDLTAAVVWANVPDGNITESSVTQHEGAIDHDALANFLASEHFTQAAISITESQISNLGAYLLDVVDDTSPSLGGNLASNGNDINMADGDKVFWGTVGQFSIQNTSSEVFFDSVVNDIVSFTAAGVRKFQIDHAAKLLFIKDGYALKIEDLNGNGNVSFVHNTVDFKSIFTLTGNWDITGLSGRIKQDAETLAFVSELFSESFGDLSDVDLTGSSQDDLLVLGGAGWVDTAGKLTWSGSNFFVDGTGEYTGILSMRNAALALFGPGNVDNLSISNDDTDINFVNSGLVDWNITGLSGRIKQGAETLAFLSELSSGDVTKVGTPANNQVGVWTGDGTIEGDIALTFESGVLNSTRLRAGFGNQSLPSISFTGETGTGLYRQSAGILGVSILGSSDWFFRTTHFHANLANGPAMVKEAPSATNPVFAQDFQDLTSGLGGISGFPALIGSGVTLAETIAAASGGLRVNNTLTGAGIERVLTVGDLPAASVENDVVQARRTTDLILTTSYVDVTLDTTDIESDAAEIEHDAVTDRIVVKTTGLYEIGYEVDVETTETSGSLIITADGRVRVNDTGVDIAGSIAQQGSVRDTSFDGEHLNCHLSNSFFVNLTANDFVTLQLRKTELSGSGSGQFEAVRTTLKVKRLN